MTKYIFKDTDFTPYIMLPRYLLQFGISDTAIILYSLLLDRVRLSVTNPKWRDDRGRVFVIYTIQQLAEDSNHSLRTVKNTLALLEKVDLIERKHRRIGSANLIYVKIPEAGTAVQELPAAGEISAPPKGQSLPMTGEKAIPPERATLAPCMGKTDTGIKNYRERTTEKEQKIKKHSYGVYGNVFLAEEEYEHLRKNYPGLEQLIEKMSCYLKSTGKSYSDYEAALRSWAQREPASFQAMDYSFEEGESL